MNTYRRVGRAGRALGTTGALALGAVLSSLRPCGAQSEREDLEGRERYLRGILAPPGKEVPNDAIERARQAARTLPSTAFFAGGFSDWRPLGTGGFIGQNGFFGSGGMLDAGRVDRVGVSAADPRTMFAATGGGGVWRSIDGGRSWSATSDRECALQVGAVTVDPVNPSIVYAGTGSFDQGNPPGCGMLRSTDGGRTWTRYVMGTTSFSYVSRILVDAQTAGSTSSTLVFAAGIYGLYRSTNSGATWTQVLPAWSSSVVRHPTDRSVLYASGATALSNPTRGIYRSSDKGITWTVLPSPVTPASDMARIDLATSPAAPDLLVALIADAKGKFLALFAWDNAAEQWTKLGAAGLYTGESRGDFGTQGTYDLALAVDPLDASRIYVAGVRAFRSRDGGATFTQMGQEIHVDWHDIVVDPKDPTVLYAGTDGGVFVSTDGGDTWSARNSGLAIAQYYPGISVHPQGQLVLGGSQDNGTHSYSGSSLWSGIGGGDGGYTAINPLQPSTYYLESQWSSSSGAALSRCTASGCSRRTTGIDKTDRGSFIPPYVLHPIKPTTLYFGTHRLYRTDDEGLTWAPISGDLTRGTGSITAIAVAAANPEKIYVGTNDGQVSVSQDGGTTFTPVTTGLPRNSVGRIAVDPNDADHAVATFLYYGTGSGHVYMTTDGGATWKNVSGALPDAPTIAALFLTSSVILVGTDVGVFQSSDNGATWQAGPAGLPNIRVNDLVYSPGLKMVVAATFGRGMWGYTVNGEIVVLRGDVTGDGRIDAADALAVQQALVGLTPSAAPVPYPAGDANCNLRLDALDALTILRAAVGLTTAGSCLGR